MPAVNAFVALTGRSGWYISSQLTTHAGEPAIKDLYYCEITILKSVPR
jgi:hypothetical protein